MNLVGALKSLLNNFTGGTSQLTALTELMFISIRDIFETLAIDFNDQVKHEPLRIYVSKMITDMEDPSAPRFRFNVSTSLEALSIRGKLGAIDFFALPTTDLVSAHNESAGRLRMSLILKDEGRGTHWTMNGIPLSNEELKTILKSQMKDLALKSKGDFELVPDALKLRISADSLSLSSSVRALVEEKHALAIKIVEQQEDLQNNIARDIHDAVLSNVMVLKQSLGGKRQLSDEQMVHMLNEIDERLREICQSLAPRDLQEWGLEFALKDLLYSLTESGEMEGKFQCADTVPRLPKQVELQIYRIVQECLNNIRKYANATAVTIEVTQTPALLTFTIADNGQGFESGKKTSRSTKHGGTGTTIMQERTELISHFCPARLLTESQPNAGTKTTLQVDIHDLTIVPPEK